MGDAKGLPDQGPQKQTGGARWLPSNRREERASIILREYQKQ